MLDGRTSAVLAKINALGEGSRIAEERDLLSVLPDGTAEELGHILGDLEERRFIEVRYAEEGVYCLRSLPEGRAYFERLGEQAQERVCRRRELVLFSALGGFLGALVAGIPVLIVLLLV